MNQSNVLDPSSATAANPGGEMSVLSAYMSAAGAGALPAEAVEHAKHHMLDTFASMISGSELPPGQAALRYVGSHAGQGDGDGCRLEPRRRTDRCRARQRRPGPRRRNRRLAQRLAVASRVRRRAGGAGGRRGVRRSTERASCVP